MVGGMRGYWWLATTMFIILFPDVVRGLRPAGSSTACWTERGLCCGGDSLWHYHCWCQPDPTWPRPHPGAHTWPLKQSLLTHTQKHVCEERVKWREIHTGGQDGTRGEGWWSRSCGRAECVCVWVRLTDGNYCVVSVWQRTQMANERLLCWQVQPCSAARPVPRVSSAALSPPDNSPHNEAF